MKRSCVIAIIAFIILIALTLSGCVEFFTGDSSEETLKLLTPEDIESIFASITVDVTDKYVAETDAQGNDIVYWLKGGSVWHASKLCGSIENADEDSVIRGTIQEAISCGKKRSCKICSDGAEAPDALTGVADTSSSELHQSVDETKIAVDQSTLVFWLKNGTVWHLDYNCRSLTGAERDAIHTGTIGNAYADGKKRGCKNCASDVELDYSSFVPNVSESTESETIETTKAIDKYIKEYAEDGKLIVFWLDGSKIWHESRYCSSLSRSDPSKLNSGCIDDALDSGKERACKNCS